MKIFISHKFQGVDKIDLRKNIEKIYSILKTNGHATFNYFRDKENWVEKEHLPGEVIKEAFEEIRKCDALLVFINHKEKGEGLLLEFGFAKALNKKIILLIAKDCCPTFLEAISDEVIKFEDFQDITKELSNL